MSGLLRSVIVVAAMSVGLSSVLHVGARAQAGSNLPWMNTSLSPEQRADLLIPQMTLEQKVQQLSNDTRPAENPANRPRGCEFTPIGRHIQGIPELGIPTVRMINGGTGVRGGDCLPEPVATALPSTPASAATFNPELGRQLGDILGDEARRDGHQVLLGPGMNLHRHPYGGRNYEYQSEDPYLSGVMASETIKGIQANGIHANAKHFAGNEQETQRRQMAAVIPPRALHELYLLPFEMAVKDAQPASIMCAFPQINGVSACSNVDLLETTLREQWGFQGYVITDRRALHDLAPSIKAGVDWELSHITPLHYSLDPQRGQGGNPGTEGIRAALAAGTITVSDLDQMLRRRYVQMFKFGHFDTDFDVLFEASPDFLAHGLVAREIAEQGIVLLKNQNNFLPLNPTSISSVALIGAEWFAGMAKLPPRSIRADNTGVIAPYMVTPKKGLENVLRAMGSSATVTYNSAGGTGRKADRDAAVELAKNSDVVIVMVGDNPHELCDRENLRLPIIPPADPNFCAYDDAGAPQLPKPDRGTGTDQESLMNELVAAPGVAQKMVVVLKTEGMVLMPWLDQVPALVEAWYPGQEDGNAVADILFGLRNPSGKLPMTFGNTEREAAYATTEQFPGVLVVPPPWLTRKRLSAQYTEGLQVGYRWYEANNVMPVFPFGFGLSYTTFAYSGLSVVPAANPQTGTTVLGVTYTITNTGSREGAETSQVYLTLPPDAAQPSKRLVGFQKVDLQPGASQQVTVTIDAGASNHPLSYWVPQNDAPVPGWANGSWNAAPGDYTVHVGTSSADAPLVQSVSLGSVSQGTTGTPTGAGCATGQPAPDWVCVNGGWLPPGLAPSGGGSVPPPPPPPAGCATGQPAPDWVCVNGGWVPPGLAPSGGGSAPPPPPPPSGCATAQPAPDWVCVNGGWLPPDLAPSNGGSTPPPSPPSSSCATPQPASTWVCVNGGWVPPDHPIATGEPPPSILPELVLADRAHVVQVRDSLRRGEPQFQDALTDLEEAANEALDVAPMSVMDKGVTPPSGDKHDYMSQAPYWWPDPSRPDGRPYIRKDGQRNPEIDRITDRDNLGRLRSAVASLALASYFSGRDQYAQHAAHLIRVWFLDPSTRMNPNLRFGQGIPGIAEGRSAGIIETRLLVDIIDGVRLLQGSSAWTSSDDAGLQDWMRAYVTWLRESSFGHDEATRGNNQETWYDAQVAVLAFYSGQPDVARQTVEAARASIGRQFEPDGGQPRELARTRAWDYSIFNLSAFLELATLGDRIGVDLWNYSTGDGRSLRAGIDFLVPFATDEEAFPYEQITRLDPSLLQPILRWAAVGLRDPKYRDIAQHIGGGSSRLDLTLP